MKRCVMVLACGLSCGLLIGDGPASSVAQDADARKVTAEDMPRIPHTDLSDALSTFRVARDFQLELVAGEPLVSDPVDACFDEFGRMYVAEMHGYPFSQEPTRLNPAGGGDQDAGIIRLLEDTDGDGRMDRSVVFADKISWPTSVCCYDGGVFVIAPQYLYYFKDTDGDGRADVREVVLSGFGRDNVQSVTNGLQWGLDNRITFAAGRNPKELKHRDKTMFAVGSSDLTFNPKTEEFELATGGLQFGHTTDDWGTRFVCSNSNHIQQVIYDQRYLGRNPYFAASGPILSIATDGASARVFRISPPEPWRIIRQKWRALDKGYRLVINDDGGWEFIPLDPSKKKDAVPTEYPVGFFTSATGITIYRGDAYPAEFRGNAFVGDVGGNLVHRKTVNTDGVIYSASRADEGVEFVQCSDNWFRPVNFVNAPDGTLYVLDMYRETVEHPFSIPDEIKEFLHLTSGKDRGRIYRLVSPGMQRRVPVVLGKLGNVELVEQLNSTNGWTRMTAQRLLWERQDQSVVPAVRKLLQASQNPLGRLHALCTLDGLGQLQVEDVVRGMRDEHPRVRAHSIRLAESLLAEHAEPLLAVMVPLHADDSEHVRFQLAFSLGESDHPQALEGLRLLAEDQRNAGVVRTALMSSVGQSAGQLATRLLNSPKFLARAHAAGLLSELALVAGANPAPAEALQMLRGLTAEGTPLATQQRLLIGLGQGLGRRGATLSQLLAGDATPAELKQRVSGLFERAARLAEDSDQSLEQRAAALRLLAFADFESVSESLEKFLSPQTPPPLQRAAVAALGEQDSDQIAALLVSEWAGLTPQVRRDAVDALISSPARIDRLMTAVADGVIKRGDIERDKKQLLMNHPNMDVRARGRELFGSEVSTNRAAVVTEYQNVLNLEGDAGRGREVFAKKCSVCHRVGDLGHQVAPDLASVQNKSTADLLIAILDPNREAQPNYNVYSVLTSQGRVYNGIIAAETASSITLRRAEAKEDVVLRNNIDELVASGVSLMPEGLEKDLSRQDLADVIQFVKSIKPKK